MNFPPTKQEIESSPAVAFNAFVSNGLLHRLVLLQNKGCYYGPQVQDRCCRTRNEKMARPAVRNLGAGQIRPQPVCRKWFLALIAVDEILGSWAKHQTGRAGFAT